MRGSASTNAQTDGCDGLGLEQSTANFGNTTFHDTRCVLYYSLLAVV